MAKKSKLLAEIGEQMKNLSTVKIEELNIDILNAMSRKFMDLEDERDSRYGLHEVSEIVMITFLGLLAKCDEWEEIYLFGVEHYEWFKVNNDERDGYDRFERLRKNMCRIYIREDQ